MTIQSATLGGTLSGSRPSGRLLWVPLVSVWLLLSATFTWPGRTGAESIESIDALALFKVCVRGLVFVALGLAILKLRRHASWTAASRGFTPFALFVVWSLISCFWSPLPAFSAGEALTLFTLFLLAVALAMAWRTSADTSFVLGQLSAAFLLACAVLLVVYAVNPELSGLQRASDSQGAVGLLHPTKVGATASLGLVLVVSCRLIWNWRWTRTLLLPSLVVFPIVMILAASRMALGLAIVLTGLVVCRWGHRRWLATLLLAVSLGGIAYPLADPELEAARSVLNTSADYALRGESVDTLRTLTGRTELWAALRESFLRAPLVGHGYFVTSETGSLEIWSRSTNILAHNLLLQVAVSTGLVGLTLFLVGLWRPIAAACRRLGATGEGRRLRGAAAVVGVWYLGWGLLSESFMGALSPEAVLAFSLLGLIAGAWEPQAG